MNLTKKLSLALTIVAAACLVHADEPASTDTSAGTLGQRYAELSFTNQVIEHVPSNNNYYYGELGANVPVTKGLDLGGSYTYGWFNHLGQSLRSNLGEADATAYVTCAGVKPFATLDLGYQWDRTTAANYFVRSEYAVWGMAAGVEVPVGPVAITPFANYGTDFRRSIASTQDLDLGIKINYWYNEHWAVFANVYHEDVMHSSSDSFNWSLGLRRKF
jgi:hypothetical protein